MEVAAPIFLLLLPLLAWFWRSASGVLPHSRILLRTTAAALLVLALSGLGLPAGDGPLSVVFVVDESESTIGARAEMNERLALMLARLRPTDQTSLVTFGARAAVERPWGAPAPFEAGSADTPGTATNIEAALAVARATIAGRQSAASGRNGPEAASASRIVLVSDGQQTDGDAVREASLAAAAGIRIDVVVPRSLDDAPGVVTRLSAPDRVRSGEPFTLRAVAEGPAGGELDVVFERDGGVIESQRVRLSTSGYGSATIAVTERAPGSYVYRAGVRAVDADDVGDVFGRSGAVVLVGGERRVLYSGEHAGRFRTLSAGAGTVDSMAPSELPRSTARLAPYDTVVLDDVPQGSLDSQQLTALAEHVEQGGAGLFVLGSSLSLEPGLLPDSSLGRMLPVDLRPRSGVRAPGLALVLVFDKSGSMDDDAGGTRKIALARQGVRAVLDAVAPTDALGIIAFDSTPTVIAPLRVGHDGAAVVERLDAIQPAGSTAIAPAFELARDWLSGEGAAFPRRHVLLISDGRSSAADADRLKALTRDGRFRVSVIALGDSTDRRLMTGLAESTGGRAYFPEDLRELPALVAREAARVAGGHSVEERFVPRASAHPILSAVDAAALPALDGYVVSALKAGAERVLASHRDDPVLAVSRYGLGRVAVYTAGLHTEWSSRARQSNAFGRLVGGTLQWLSPRSNGDPFYVRVRETDDGVLVTADVAAPDGQYVSGLRATVAVRTPSRQTIPLALAEVRPGRYEGRVAATDVGPYLLSFDVRSADGLFGAGATRGVYRAAEREHRARGVNVELLSALADATGGRTIDGNADPFTERPVTTRPVRPWLLTAAFFIFLAEILAPSLGARRARLADDDASVVAA